MFALCLWLKYLRLCAAGLGANTMGVGADARAAVAVGAAPVGTGVRAVAATGVPINGHAATGSR